MSERPDLTEDVRRLYEDAAKRTAAAMAGARARREIWPNIAEWLEDRSAR